MCVAVCLCVCMFVFLKSIILIDRNAHDKSCLRLADDIVYNVDHMFTKLKQSLFLYILFHINIILVMYFSKNQNINIKLQILNIAKNREIIVL